MKKKIWILSIAIMAVAAIGLSAFSYAEAAGVEAPVMQIGNGPAGAERPQFEEGERPLKPYIDEAQASILGVTVEELQAAQGDREQMAALIEAAGFTPEEYFAEMKAAFPGIVQAALDDGAITEEQAEMILEHGLRRPQRRGFGPLFPYVKEATADILGMDVEDLEAALADGVTMDELLDDAGLTHLDFQQALNEATPDIVEAALEDEAITQEQADQILEYGLHNCGSRRKGPGGQGNGQGSGPGAEGAPFLTNDG